MTDRELAVVVPLALFVVLLILLSGAFASGYRRGAERTRKAIQEQLAAARASRIERWSPAPPQPAGEPGTPERLVSDYEDAIYAEARHALGAQLGDGDEQQHAALAAQLHGDVRRLRGRLLNTLETQAEPPV